MAEFIKVHDSNGNATLIGVGQITSVNESRADWNVKTSICTADGKRFDVIEEPDEVLAMIGFDGDLSRKNMSGSETDGDA